MATRERIQALAVPPAWTDVWISPDDHGHIQAVGTDEAGRRQYVYHPDWTAQQDAAKHDRVLALAGRLPTVRRQITRDLRRPRLGGNRVMAGVLQILDTGSFRTGGDAYAEVYGTRGVTTPERGEVTVSGVDLRFRYPAKGGVPLDVTLHDRDLAALVTALRRARPGTDRLFVHHDGSAWHEIHADQLNERFKALAGEEFTVKDLRTWQATARAAVFRGSYVDPRVVGAGEQGRTIATALDRIGSADLALPRTRAAVERSVIRLLGRG